MPATGGAPACGPCPGYACSPSGLDFIVEPTADAPNAVIENLVASADGLHIDCRGDHGSPCRWTCQSQEQRLGDGTLTLHLSAPGFQDTTTDIVVKNPTNCGCCGCCPFSYTGTLQLAPAAGAPAPATGCCADLQTDAYACGACDHTCPTGGQCIDGKCAPVLEQCMVYGGTTATCAEQCQSMGLACADKCGPSGTEGREGWLGNSGCLSTVTGTPGSCTDPFDKSPVGSAVSTYECCCSDP